VLYLHLYNKQKTPVFVKSMILALLLSFMKVLRVFLSHLAPQYLSVATNSVDAERIVSQ